MHPLLTGLVAAPFTPFRPDGSLNLEMIPLLCDHLVTEKITAAFVCGTTGEGTSLTDGERMQVAEAWVRASGGRLKIVVHAGHLSVASSAALATHAEAIGADAVASCCPSFFPILSAAQLATCAAATAQGAPNLPFYFYHIPAFTNLRVSMLDFLSVARAQIPNLRGIKFTHSDFEEMVALLHVEHGRYEILSGREQMMLAALASGAQGAVGSNFNFVAPLYHSLRRAFALGDLNQARKIQGEGIELTAILRRFGGHAAMKALMGLIGLDCGPTRAPIRALEQREIAALNEELKTWGYFDASRNGLSGKSEVSRVNGTKQREGSVAPHGMTPG